jgi:hypothetical protein
LPSSRSLSSLVITLDGTCRTGARARRGSPLYRWCALTSAKCSEHAGPPCPVEPIRAHGCITPPSTVPFHWRQEWPSGAVRKVGGTPSESSRRRRS